MLGQVGEGRTGGEMLVMVAKEHLSPTVHATLYTGERLMIFWLRALRTNAGSSNGSSSSATEPTV